MKDSMIPAQSDYHRHETIVYTAGQGAEWAGRHPQPAHRTAPASAAASHGRNRWWTALHSIVTALDSRSARARRRAPRMP